ncbi:MAG: S41 family peptidase [Fimbriimonadaceae bacterium]|jgi:carboxyl-terminal processing protease|nr:S41 family peptidase [Fimbriimonadaceae bacterium]
MTSSLVALAMALPLAQANVSQAPQTKDDFPATWRKVESAIRGRYYGRVAQKDKMDRLLAATAPKATSATSRQKFSQIVNQMIREFGDSHFAFYTNEDQGFYLFDGLMRRDRSAEMPHIGAWFTPSATGGYTVRMVLDGQEAAKVGLRKGDVVLTINGEPFSPISSLAANLDRKNDLRVRRGNEILTFQVSVTTDRSLSLFMAATRSSAKVYELNGKKIGYVKVWTMGDRTFHEFLRIWTLNGAGTSTDAMILDLRDGFGGRPEGFFEPFFAPQMVMEWKMGSGSTTQLTGYARPLAVLTNGGTRSAKEVVAAIFKNSKRATLIGSPTAGDVLGTTPFQIEPWAFLEIPMVQLTVDGKNLEKNPVVPDIGVQPEIGGDGSDLVIAEALRHLVSQVTQTPRE